MAMIQSLLAGDPAITRAKKRNLIKCPNCDADYHPHAGSKVCRSCADELREESQQRYYQAKRARMKGTQHANQES